MNLGSVSSYEKYSTIWGDFFIPKVNFRSWGTFKIFSSTVFQSLILQKNRQIMHPCPRNLSEWSILMAFNLQAHPENFLLVKYDLGKEWERKGISKKPFRKFENAVKLSWKPPKTAVLFLYKLFWAIKDSALMFLFWVASLSFKLSIGGCFC